MLFQRAAAAFRSANESEAQCLHDGLWEFPVLLFNSVCSEQKLQHVREWFRKRGALPQHVAALAGSAGRPAAGSAYSSWRALWFVVSTFTVPWLVLLLLAGLVPPKPDGAAWRVLVGSAIPATLALLPASHFVANGVLRASLKNAACGAACCSGRPSS